MVLLLHTPYTINNIFFCIPTLAMCYKHLSVPLNILCHLLNGQVIFYSINVIGLTEPLLLVIKVCSQMVVIHVHVVKSLDKFLVVLLDQ